MNILALETATDICQVALLQGEQVTVQLGLSRPRAHAENLVPLIRDALHYAGLERSALDAVAVSKGPGSYTGLRIGVSTAKGLAAALDLKLIGIPSLDALAASVESVTAPGDVLVTAFNSRRNEVYFAVYQNTATGLESLVGPSTANVESHQEEIVPAATGRIYLAGEGAPRMQRLLSQKASVFVLDPAIFTPSAASIARLALLRLHRGEQDDLAQFEPFYLNEFVAKKAARSIFDRLPF